MLVGYKKLDKHLTNWCKNNGFNVKCKFSSDFEYDSDKHIIYYSIIVPQKHDKLFINLCKKYLPSVEKCDNFILSFFHELGHYMTENNYSDEEWNAYYNFLKELPEELTLKEYKKYYNYPIELDATIWGCTYIEEHLDEIKQFSEDLSRLIIEFYNKNNIKID